MIEGSRVHRGALNWPCRYARMLSPRRAAKSEVRMVVERIRQRIVWRVCVCGAAMAMAWRFGRPATPNFNPIGSTPQRSNRYSQVCSASHSSSPSRSHRCSNWGSGGGDVQTSDEQQHYVVAETMMMNKAQNHDSVLTCAASALSPPPHHLGHAPCPNRSGINSTTPPNRLASTRPYRACFHSSSNHIFHRGMYGTRIENRERKHDT